MELQKLDLDSGSTSTVGGPRKSKSRQTKLFYGFLIAALIGILIGLAVGIPLSGDTTTSSDPNVQQTYNLLDNYPLIDGHSDLPWQYRQYNKNKVYQVNLGQDTRVQWSNTTPMTDDVNFPRIYAQTDIPRLRQGKVGAQFWAAFVPCYTSGKDAVRVGFDQVDVIHKFVAKYPDTFEFVTTAQGILDAYQQRGKIASLIGLEGGHMIRNNLGVLRSFYRVGVRYMTLTHSCDTSWADNWKQDLSATGSRRGLTAFGEIVVKEMNRLGMMIDLSHVAKQTMLDAMRVSEAPVIFSHSSAFAKCEHYRNVQDDVLMEVKNNSGIVMVNFYDYYISRGCRPMNRTTSTMQDVIDHIDYIKNLIGVDYVGIGADYDGVDTFPDELEDVSTYPALISRMRSQGWNDADLRKLIGENLIRVFKEVEKVKEDKRSDPPYEDIIPENEIIPDLNCHTTF